MQELIAMRQGTLEQLKQTQMFQRIMTGGLDKNLYAGYLINVYHYAQHSPNVIALASSRCVRGCLETKPL